MAKNLSFSFKIKTESGKEFSLNERSKGCKWFFSFLIFTEFRKNRTENILFLLDEPASNLHSSAQLKILNAIESLSDKSVIVYSTHSQHLINPKWLNGAYIVVNEAMSSANLSGAFTDNDAKITVYKYFNYVSQNKQKKQSLFFQPILDRLDYKPSLLELISSIVITEGKFDWYTFKYINEVILDNEFKLHFYSGKGADSNDEIIRLYLAWGNKFLMLLDSDKQGRQATVKYLDLHGEFVEEKIFNYHHIFSKELTTEDLFTTNDKKAICNVAFEYNTFESIKTDKKRLKSTFNFAICQLLTLNKKVVLEDETIQKFRILFNYLKNRIL